MQLSPPSRFSIPTRQTAVGLMIFAAVFWSSSGLFIKLLSWHSLAILGGRGILAAGVILIYLGYVPLRFGRWQIAAASIHLITMFLFVIGNQVAPAANIIFLAYTAPLYLMVLSPLILGESIKKADWITLPLMLLGMGLFFVDEFSWESAYGNGIGILIGFFWALMMIAYRKQKEGPTAAAESAFLGNVIAGIIGFPFLLSAEMTLPNIGSILFLGILQIGLGFICYSIAIKTLDAMESTLIGMLEPILNPIWVFWILNEVPGPFVIAGGTLVIFGVVVRATLSAKPPNALTLSAELVEGETNGNHRL